MKKNPRIVENQQCMFLSSQMTVLLSHLKGRAYRFCCRNTLQPRDIPHPRSSPLDLSLARGCS
ncbi:hypothetical protein ES703_74193 [subsurface metagenome]